MMRRRSVIVSGGVMVGFSGCLGSVLEAESDPREDFRTSFVTTIEDDGQVALDDAYWEETVFIVEQTTTANSLAELLPELGAIAGGVAASYDVYEPEMERVEVIVSHTDGSRFGTYRIDPEWATAFVAGDLSESEYADRVAETFSPAS